MCCGISSAARSAELCKLEFSAPPQTRTGEESVGEAEELKVEWSGVSLLGPTIFTIPLCRAGAGAGLG